MSWPAYERPIGDIQYRAFCPDWGPVMSPARKYPDGWRWSARNRGDAELIWTMAQYGHEIQVDIEARGRSHSKH